ncbi:MAG: homocysteine biosynthesis protein, partial [Cyanobacteria bacterium P01_A01_bin.40]
MRTIAEINDKISCGQAVAWTVEEVKLKVAELGVAQVAQQVDVVTTGTFEPMESTGAIINLGHTDPPIKIRQCWLDGIAAYAAFGAVDLYLGATATADYNLQESDPSLREGSGGEKGGGH